MSFRNISAWCIRNPVPPVVMFVLLLLAGIVSFNRMDVNDQPDIEFPAVPVVVVQPGAAPTALETTVTHDRKSVVSGKRGSTRVLFGGRRLIKKKTKKPK